MIKRFLPLIFLPLTLMAQEVDDVVFKLENSPSPFFPYSLGGSYISVQPTKLKEDDTRSLTFRQWEAAGAFIHPFSPCSGLNFGAGWVGCEVNFEDNFDFEKTIFNYVNLLIGGYTASFEGWLWKASVAAYFDLEEFSLIDYTLYQGVLWGQYTVCPIFELDFGFIVESGLKRTKIWPLLGFNYNPFPKVLINAVFPVDISIDYTLTEWLAASGSLRFLRTRHRLLQNEVNSQGIFEYQATGAEFDLTWAPTLAFSITGYIGSSFSPDLKIADRDDSNSTHYKFEGSRYCGVTALLSF